MKIEIDRTVVQHAIEALEAGPHASILMNTGGIAQSLRTVLAAPQPAQQEPAITPSVRSVMQQALEALEKSLPRLAPYGEQDWLDSKEAIDALREALAAPANQLDGINVSYLAQQQESVASTAKGVIMSAAYEFRDAHISGSSNLKRSAHAALVSAVDAALQPAQQSIPDGYVLVPAELTKEMRAAAKPCTTVSALWASIIAAAPQPAQQDPAAYLDAEINCAYTPEEPDPDCFRPGDVWQNSRGTDFRVLRVEGRVAHMVSLASGRTHARPWDHIGAHTGRQWVRLSCGA